MIGNEIRESLKETCNALNRKGVEYMIIGGVAVAFYGYQRISGAGYPGRPEIKQDLDFWYKPTTENYYKLISALKDLKVDTKSLENLVFDPQKTYLRIPHKSYKTEFLCQMIGLNSYDECRKNAKEIELDDNELVIIGYKDLITNKTALAREVDIRDVQELNLRNK